MTRVKCTAAALYRFYFALGIMDTVPLLLADVLWKSETHLSPGDATRSQVLISLPWMIKPVIGFWSDRIAINGRNRTPYIYFFLPLIVLAWSSVQFLEFATQNDVIVLVLSFASFATVFVDVVYDAILCEFTKEEPLGEHGKYQAGKSKWRSVGSLVGAILNTITLTVEEHTDLLNIKSNLVLIPLFIFAVWVDALVNMRETQGDPESNDLKANTTQRYWRWCTHNVWATAHDTLHRLVHHDVTKICLVVFAIAAAPHVGKALQFFFLDTQVGLGIKPKILSWISIITELCQVVAVVLYERSFRYYSFRTIMLACILFGTVGSLLPIVLVEGWNEQIGIPDWLFLLTDESFMAVVVTVIHIPIMRETAKASHDDWQATTYAAVAALENGTTMAGMWFGAVLMDAMGLDGVNFDRLTELLLICGGIGLVSIPFVFCAPNIPGAKRSPSPQEIRYNVENMDEEGQSQSMIPLKVMTSSTRETVNNEEEIESLVGSGSECSQSRLDMQTVPLCESNNDEDDSATQAVP